MRLLLLGLATLIVAFTCLTTARPLHPPYSTILKCNSESQYLCDSLQPPTQSQIEDTTTAPHPNQPTDRDSAIEERHTALTRRVAPANCERASHDALESIMEEAGEDWQFYEKVQKLRRLIISPDVPENCKDLLMELWQAVQNGKDIGDVPGEYNPEEDEGFDPPPFYVGPPQFAKERSVDEQTEQHNALFRRLSGCERFEHDALEVILWQAEEDGVTYGKAQQLRRLIISPDVPERCKPSLMERWKALQNGKDIGDIVSDSPKERSVHEQAKEPDALTRGTAQSCVDPERKVLELIMEEAGEDAATYGKREKLRRLIIDPHMPERCRDWEMERWEVLAAGGDIGDIPAEDYLEPPHQHEPHDTEPEMEPEGALVFDSKHLQPLKVPNQNPDWLKEKFEHSNESESEPTFEDFWNSGAPAPRPTKRAANPRDNGWLHGDRDHCEDKERDLLEKIKQREDPDFDAAHLLRMLIVDPEMDDKCREGLLNKWDAFQKGEEDPGEFVEGILES